MCVWQITHHWNAPCKIVNSICVIRERATCTSSKQLRQYNKMVKNRLIPPTKKRKNRNKNHGINSRERENFIWRQWIRIWGINQFLLTSAVNTIGAIGNTIKKIKENTFNLTLALPRWCLNQMLTISKQLENVF